MKLRKCKICKSYTLKEVCDKCKGKTSDAHYKFIKVRSQENQETKVKN